ERRLAERIVAHADLAQEETVAEARARRLHQRFLGREAPCQELRRARRALVLPELAAAQDALGEAAPETDEACLDPGDFHHVDADAVDHDRASRMRRFISATASGRPVNTARAMMACPMLSSTISG